jgi:hypothetical protein
MFQRFGVEYLAPLAGWSPGTTYDGGMRTDDDRRHDPTDEPWWAEIWEFEFAVPDATMAMFTRLSVYPNLNQTWFWAAVVRKGRPYVLCRDQEIAAPKPAWPLEIRGEGLWSHAICETPLDHWTVAMEAFAVGFDDPMEAWRAERGDKVGLAFDLEWERTEELVKLGGHGFEGYQMDCKVSGELQIDSEKTEIDAMGSRMHTWGLADPMQLIIDEPDAGRTALLRAPIQIDLPDGKRRRVIRSLRRFPRGQQRWDFILSD